MIAILWNGYTKVYGHLDVTGSAMQFSALDNAHHNQSLRLPLCYITTASYYHLYQIKLQGITLHCDNNMTYTFIVQQPYKLMQKIEKHIMQYKIRELLITDN